MKAIALPLLAPLAVSMLAAGCGSDGDDGPRIASEQALESFPLSGGAGGVGFDDLVFTPGLDRVLAPGGGTGALSLIAPDTRAVVAIDGFSHTSHGFRGGHGDGVTSAAEGRGLLFAVDRTTLTLNVVDPESRRITATAKLGGAPDYVRYVETTGEVWVTEPDASRIEVFALPGGHDPKPESAALVEVTGGPESLVIDETRARAYTHHWKGISVAIDLRTRRIVSLWPNTCGSSRGIALDEPRGLLFAGCAEGKAAVLDVAHDGKVVSTLARGAGVDQIAYDGVHGRLYVPGAATGKLEILSVSPAGELAFLAEIDTVNGSHCAAVDLRGGVWLCDPSGGRVLRVQDPTLQPAK